MDRGVKPQVKQMNSAYVNDICLVASGICHLQHVRIQRGDRGPDSPPPPLKINNNIGYLGSTGLDPL